MTPWITAHPASLSFTISLIMLKFMSIESVIPSTNSSSAIPFFSCTQSFQASRSFQLICSSPYMESHWNFSFSISPFNEYSQLIPFMIDWFVPLAVQRTLNSLLHYQSSKASVLQHSVFFMVQLSQPYKTTVWLGETTGRTIALTIKNFKWDSVTVELDFKFNGIQIYIAMWI